jgi:hypothetical protein
LERRGAGRRIAGVPLERRVAQLRIDGIPLERRVAQLRIDGIPLERRVAHLRIDGVRSTQLRIDGIRSVPPARKRRIGVRRGGCLIHPAFLVAAAVALVAASAIGGAGPPRVGPVVVSVEARGLQGATGFIAADGRVVTVAHAVGHGAIVVRGPGGASRAATVVRRDDELDLALLAVPGVDDREAPPALGGTRLLVRRDGATATVPADVRRRIDARVRDAATDEVVRRPALELAARIRAGDSGAPVIGTDGRVAGVVFARSSDRDGVAYAVDGAALATFLR